MNYDQSTQELLITAENSKLQGRFEEAIITLQKIIVHEPRCSEAYEELGDNYLSLRKFKRAEKALLQSIKTNPRSANAHYLLGFLLSIEQRWTVSVEELKKADRLFPNHPEILRCLGWSFYNQNRQSARGIALLERSKSLNPKDPNILCDLGACYLNSSNFDKAEELFRQAIEINPHSEQANECRMFLKMIQNRRTTNPD